MTLERMGPGTVRVTTVDHASDLLTIDIRSYGIDDGKPSVGLDFMTHEGRDTSKVTWIILRPNETAELLKEIAAAVRLLGEPE